MMVKHLVKPLLTFRFAAAAYCAAVLVVHLAGCQGVKKTTDQRTDTRLSLTDTVRVVSEFARAVDSSRTVREVYTFQPPPVIIHQSDTTINHYPRLQPILIRYERETGDQVRRYDEGRRDSGRHQALGVTTTQDQHATTDRGRNWQGALIVFAIGGALALIIAALGLYKKLTHDVR